MPLLISCDKSTSGLKLHQQMFRLYLGNFVFLKGCEALEQAAQETSVVHYP